MKPISDFHQQQTYEYIVRFRAGWGVSPTLREIANAFRVPKSTVQSRIGNLNVGGYLVKAGKSARCWVPSFEARLMDRWPDVVKVLERVAGEDADASELLEYARRTV